MFNNILYNLTWTAIYSELFTYLPNYFTYFDEKVFDDVVFLKPVFYSIVASEVT